MIGNKKHFLVAGATGLVGSTLVEMLLSNETVGKVTVLVRRATSFESEKLEERMIDFDSFTEREIAPSVDAIFCCLGTTMAQAGGKDAFRRVDYEYPVKLAVFAQRQNIQQFHVISSSGASPTSKIFYSKVKGRMELEIKKLDKIRSIYIYRPSMLLGDRTEFRFGESLGKFFMKALSFMLPNSIKAVHANEVSYTMVNNALSPQKGVHVVSNSEILQ
jgi:uncharacterized protein YbjT (DUF2867 family)